MSSSRSIRAALPASRTVLFAAALGLAACADSPDGRRTAAPTEPNAQRAPDRQVSGDFVPPHLPERPATGPAPLVRRPQGAVRGQYIVLLRREVQDVDAVSDALVRAGGGQRLHTYRHALKGFAARLPDAAVEALRDNPNVVSVEEDGTFEVRAAVTQASPWWGLDRIDQRALPLSGSFTYTPTGAGVEIHIIDTGVRRTHTEFGGRAILGVDYIKDGQQDCHGHGTHVAGIAGATTWGVAKGATIVDVRVANCAGGGYFSNAVAAFDWVTARKVANPARPMVANMSFGWYLPLGSPETAAETAVRNSIAAGVVYAGATPNARIESCADFPSRIPGEITVANANITDQMVSRTGFGSCIHIFAPGTGIRSTGITDDAATRDASGTSMATPHVVGVAALYLEAHPTATPAQVKAVMLAEATAGVLTDQTGGGALPAGTPNLLLYSGFTAIVRSPQTIVVTSVLPTNAVVTSTFTLAATGGASGQPVVFTTQTPLTCTTTGANGTTLTLTAAGACTVAATQAGTAAYEPAPAQTLNLTVLTPAQATGALRAAVVASTLTPDLRPALTAKLDDALKALAAGKTKPACGALAEFAEQVRAQRGKAIPADTADAWLADAAAIRKAAGC